MLFFNRRGNFFPTKTITILSLLVPYVTHSSLSATTAQTIHGNTPKLNTSLEIEITNQSLNLLGIEVSGTPYYGGSTITISTPETTKFNELIPIVNTLVAGDANDIDGDNNFSLSPLSTNSLSIKIMDATNTSITVADANQTLCDVLSSNPLYPYTLNVVGDLKLTTQYGDPNTQNYTATEGMNIQPKSPKIYLKIVGACYAKPNLNFDFPGSDSNVWDPSKGFKLQSATNPNKNFPTTGFHNAVFEIKVRGIVANAAGTTWVATPTNLGTNITVTASAISSDTVKVKLSGPSSGVYDSAHPPAAFIAPGVIMIKDNSNTVSYSFNIQKWFIADPNIAADFTAAKYYCDNLAGGTYTLPTNAQFTNSNLTGGQSPSNNYIRAIEQSLLPEWGALYYDGNPQYPDTDWNIAIGPFPTYKSYWSADQQSSNRQYDIGVSGGMIGDNDITSSGFYTACVSK